MTPDWHWLLIGALLILNVMWMWLVRRSQANSKKMAVQTDKALAMMKEYEALVERWKAMAMK